MEKMEVDVNYVVDNINEFRKSFKVLSDSSSFSIEPYIECDFKKFSILLTVLDTNILILHLNEIKKIVEDNVKTINNHTEKSIICFIVPWIVLKELDILKANKQSIGQTSRDVINYLLEQSTIKCKFFKFQNSIEHEEPLIEINCYTNDDFILKCAIKIKNKNPTIRVLLLTNDKNLQIKSMITNINSMNYEMFSIYINIENVCKIENTSIDNCNTNDKSLAIIDNCIFSLINCLVDLFVKDISVALLKLLSLLYEKEMTKVYNDLWLDLLPYPPPWNLKTITFNINKHYNALFGFSLDLNAKVKWKKISDYINLFVEKVKHIDKFKIIEFLKLLINITAEILSFCDIVNNKCPFEDSVLVLKKNLESIDKNLIKVYKMYELFMNIKKVNLCNIKELNYKSFGCLIFDPIWNKLNELCFKLKNVSLINTSEQEELYLFCKCFKIITMILIETYQRCLINRNEQNLEALSVLVMILHCFFDIKIVNDEKEMFDNFYIIHKSISESFFSLDKSDLLNNGLQQLHEYFSFYNQYLEKENNKL